MPKKEYVEAFSPEEALAAVPDALRPVARVIYGPELEAYYVYTILGYDYDAKDTRLFAQRLLLGFVREGQWVPSRSYDIFCEQAWQRQAEQQAKQPAEQQAEAQEAQAEPTAAQAVTPDDIELPCFPDEVNAVTAEEVAAAAQELAVARSHAEQQQAKLAATLEVNAQLKQHLAELEAQLEAQLKA